MKVIWASRHAMDTDAEASLRRLLFEHDVVIESRELLWPTGASDCNNLLRNLAEERCVLCGVFPAQAQEAILWARIERVTNREDWALEFGVMSPVSVPETEPDVKKVRPFRFVRWAHLM